MASANRRALRLTARIAESFMLAYAGWQAITMLWGMG